jgi:hypothetical protein
MFYKDYYDASWESIPMENDYAIVKFETNDINYLRHVRECFDKLNWDGFYRGNKEWVIIGVDTNDIENWAEQFKKSGCLVSISVINKR